MSHRKLIKAKLIHLSFYWSNPRLRFIANSSLKMLKNKSLLTKVFESLENFKLFECFQAVTYESQLTDFPATVVNFPPQITFLTYLIVSKVA